MDGGKSGNRTTTLVWLAQTLEVSYSFADKSPQQFPNVNACELVIGPCDCAGRDRSF